MVDYVNALKVGFPTWLPAFIVRFACKSRIRRVHGREGKGEAVHVL
jgi:hypothetical protein